jgi:hypothetical protein
VQKRPDGTFLKGDFDVRGDAMRIRQPIDPRELHKLLRRYDIPWIVYMFIWHRVAEDSEPRRELTEIFFDGAACNAQGEATLRDLSDQTWRKAFADCAMKHVEIQIATVEVLQEMQEYRDSYQPWRVERVRIETTGPMSLGQLLLYLRNQAQGYQGYNVAFGNRPTETGAVELEPVIDAYADDRAEDLLLRTGQSDKEKEEVPAPLQLDVLAAKLESLQEGRSNFAVECTDADPNDKESVVRIDHPVQGIGVNDECRLFVFLH